MRRVSGASGEPEAGPRGEPWSLGWLPVIVLVLGGLAGLLLWHRWGLAVAFEAVRTYCF